MTRSTSFARYPPRTSGGPGSDGGEGPRGEVVPLPPGPPPALKERSPLPAPPDDAPGDHDAPRAPEGAASAPRPAATRTVAATGSEAPGAGVPAGPGEPATANAFPTLELAPEPPFRLPSLRAPLVVFLFLLLVGGVLYPVGFSYLAREVAPSTASSLVPLVGENISNPSLFWERPSLIDWTPIWNATTGRGAGAETPYGPVDPLLLNQTLAYVQAYGLGNDTVPLDLVSPSASGLDPDIYPDAALVQVPRVAARMAGSTNVSYAVALHVVWGLVNDTITPPAAGIVGPWYVNVITLDGRLLLLLPPGTPVVVAS